MMLLMVRVWSLHKLSTNSVSIFSREQRSWIHLRRDFVLFVASKMAMIPLSFRNHLTISVTAASAAARRNRSPSGFDVSKKAAEGFGVALRRYWPTLKVFAFIDSQRKYRITV